MPKIHDIVGNREIELLGWDGSKKGKEVQPRVKNRPQKRKDHNGKKATTSHSSIVSRSRGGRKRQLVKPHCVKCGRQCTARTDRDPGSAICEPCVYALQRKAGYVPQPLPQKKKKKRTEFVRIVYSALETNRRRH